MTEKKFTKEDIVGAECRHVIYIPPVDGDQSDYHLCKEILHVKDGDKVVQVPNVRIIKDYKVKFWITKDYYKKTHTQKKEWEDIDKLKEFSCTRSQLLERASKALGNYKPPRSLRQLAQSPYLYGCDISSTAAVKQEVYRNRFPNLFTQSTVAASDTETCIYSGKVLMQTLSCKEKVYTAIDRKFLNMLGGDDDFKKKILREALDKYLGDVVAARNIKWEIDLVADDGVVVWNTLRKAHEWKPDIMTFWNMNFDIKKMNEALENNDISLANAWSDPSVPEAYRFFNYKEGQAQKVTASGKVTPVPFQARWHTVTTPASFYVLDAMCCYKQVRTGKQEEREYSLEFILNKHLKRGKLKFEAADGLAKADWHIFMQKNYPVEYVIYNLFDCIGMEMLDEKTKDLAVSVPSGAAMSDYSKFNSQPRRVCDKLHYFVLNRNRVMGTTSDKMATELDNKTIGLREWIIMLPAHLVADNGLKMVIEYPYLTTNIRLHVGD